MFDSMSQGGMVLNWRGPLLAAGIFAAAFAILLVMAHQNQSSTSDMGSSLREDPYGTSLLFDSYARAGYQVNRSQDEDTLTDQNAGKTTAFLIGGDPLGDWENGNGDPTLGKLRGRLEDFLSRGGRVVLIQPNWKLKSKSQGWEVENIWNKTPHESGPTWISPDLREMPAGSEMMYLGADVPSLKTDAHWTTLYAGPAEANAKADTKAETSAHVYMAMRRAGNGELIAASQESFLLNEAIKRHPNPVLLDFMTGGRPVIWVDETLHGLRQNQGVLWLVQRYRLQPALMLFWAALLALLWSMSGDLLRRPKRNQNAQIVRQVESAAVAARHLLQRSIPAGQVVAECWEQYRRRSPQDAQVISADPVFGPRLRAALTHATLAGYKELSELIAERRATAKGLVPAERVVR
jgi:hypothetical protein